MHRHILSEAREHGCRIDEVFVCPHAPADNCPCRKPAPGLIEQAIEASGIVAGDTVLIGDALRDLEAAEAAEVRPILVRTGKGRETEQQLDGRDVMTYDDLLDAARAVLNETE